VNVRIAALAPVGAPRLNNPTMPAAHGTSLRQTLAIVDWNKLPAGIAKARALVHVGGHHPRLPDGMDAARAEAPAVPFPLIQAASKRVELSIRSSDNPTVPVAIAPLAAVRRSSCRRRRSNSEE
jgi:hypothetical protein